MYKAKIKTDAGKTFVFSYENGVVFDISPLSGTDVTVTASQGFNQIGQTVTGQSVSGIRRTISGVILSAKKEREMLSALPAFTTGTLTVNDEYYCNITVQKTPEIALAKNGRRVLTMQVFCDTPFWLKSKESAYVLNAYIPSFAFPVLYDSHVYGVKSEGGYIDVQNAGDVPVPYTATLQSSGSALNYGIINIITGAEIRFGDVLSSGETVVFTRKGGRVSAVKTADGETRSIIGTISDGSGLFELAPGSNVLRVIADEGEENLSASITFYPAYMGVVV